MEGSSGSDRELVSKTLQVEHKLFYFDLKDNPRGRYLKISEKTSATRSTIIVPASGISYFVDIFKYYATDFEHSSKDSSFESSELELDIKTFYFDVGENQRGRFLKISEMSVSRNRSTIIVPAVNEAFEGWTAFHNVLAEINDAQHLYRLPSSAVRLQEPSLPSDPVAVQSLGARLMGGSSPVGSSGSPVNDDSMVSISDVGRMPFSKVLRAEQKKFFFDLGSNARGQYLRISEVTGTDRAAIILPASALEQFYETLGQLVERVRSQGLTGAGLTRAQVATPWKRNEV